MSHTTDISLKNARPRAQTFDGFLTKQRALYDRLFGQGRKQRIPVRDLTPGTKKISTLSSYMIDPQYLDQRGSALQPFTLHKEESPLGGPIEPRTALANIGASVSALTKESWHRVRFLIPRRYFKTFYSIDGGARSYLFTRTQKLATVAAASTVGMAAVFTLAFLHSTVDFPGYPATPSVAAQHSQARETPAATTTTEAGSPVATPESPAAVPTANPQRADAPASATAPVQPVVNTTTPTVLAVPPVDKTPQAVAPVATETTGETSNDVLSAPLNTIQETVDSATDLLGL